jgi:hypothetical protein
VIARISGEGQYRLSDGDAGRLNELDNDVVAAVESGDEARFRSLFDEMLTLVRGGEALDADDLQGSDVILPPPDTSLDEAKAEFSGEGLIPG